jgi:murein tripeptide amidase MpaA
MARQHPGELVGSFLMEQIMDMIEKQTTEIEALMKIYTVILIPMANPDGVIHGNSRCNLAGLDLNRQWMK